MRRLSPPTVGIKAYGDQEVRVLGSIVLHMHTNKKADRVIWQVTDTSGFPILGRTKAKLINYITYPEIHAPQQQQSSVSQDSIKSTDPKFNWKFNWSNLTDWSKFGQTVQTAQSMDSLQTKPKLVRKFEQSKFDQTAQKEHQVLHMSQNLHKSLGVRIP